MDIITIHSIYGLSAILPILAPMAGQKNAVKSLLFGCLLWDAAPQRYSFGFRGGFGPRVTRALKVSTDIDPLPILQFVHEGLKPTHRLASDVHQLL